MPCRCREADLMLPLVPSSQPTGVRGLPPQPCAFQPCWILMLSVPQFAFVLLEALGAGDKAPLGKCPGIEAGEQKPGGCFMHQASPGMRAEGWRSAQRAWGPCGRGLRFQ